MLLRSRAGSPPSRTGARRGTVNTAARMESHGVPGRIHISPTTYALVRHNFVCESRGLIEIKGKGELETWFVEGPLTRPK